MNVVVSEDPKKTLVSLNRQAILPMLRRDGEVYKLARANGLGLRLCRQGFLCPLVVGGVQGEVSAASSC